MFPKHIPTLDGLRGFAAIWVVLYHFRTEGLFPYMDGQTGEYGVLLFFILSGFLMGHLYLSQPFTFQKVCDYGISRFSRIVPMFYIAVLGCYAASLVMGKHFIFYLTSADLFRLFTFNGSLHVFWSVAPEVQFYVLFVGVWALFSLNDRMRSMAIAPVFLILALLFFVQSMFPGILVLSKLHIFLTGTFMAVLAARAAPLPEITRSPFVIGAQLVAIGVLALLTFTKAIHSPLLNPAHMEYDRLYNFFYGNFRWIFLMAAILMVIAVQTPLSRALFANTFMRLAGKYSFSIYLLHVPVMASVRDATTPLGWIQPVQTVAALVAVAAVGPIAFYCIERPFQTWCRSGLRRLVAGYTGWSEKRAGRRWPPVWTGPASE